MRFRVWILIALFFFGLNPVLGKTSEAIFAGGCFWCVEADFKKVPGVINAQSGYDGGSIMRPTYQLVSAGETNYVESVRVTFNPDIISYKALVDYFWRHIDPTVKDRQFCDVGHQYRSAIFYLNKEQKTIALASKKKLEKKFPTIYTEITASTHFYVAEAYHQNYSTNHPWRYKYYRYRCGRDQRTQEIWQNEEP
jgi:peptide-methionine (S)-S-oxide reductase